MAIAHQRTRGRATGRVSRFSPAPVFTKTLRPEAPTLGAVDLRVTVGTTREDGVVTIGFKSDDGRALLVSW
jgi:hypothetical protein